MSTPQHLRYTKDHEWISAEGNIATVGITHYAQDQLGDIVFVDINTVGRTLAAEAVFGSVEAVKTVSDLFLPVSGTIIEKNDIIDASPELVNTDPYGAGWMVKVEMDDPSQFDTLLDAEGYRALTGE
ncbi:MAG: glycine cleavage system protein GcvH [Bacteroidetes bacterium]|nr:glycine cleavage system protein GcvH [Bacteroidota bacterium]